MASIKFFLTIGNNAKFYGDKVRDALTNDSDFDEATSQSDSDVDIGVQLPQAGVSGTGTGSGGTSTGSVTVRGSVGVIIIGSNNTVNGDTTVNIATEMPKVPDEIVGLLTETGQSLLEQLYNVPEGNVYEVQETRIALQDAFNEVAKEEPDPVHVQIRGDNLLKAARNLAAVTPSVLQIADQVVDYLREIVF